MKVTIADMDKRKKAIADLIKQNLGVSVTGGVIKVDGKQAEPQLALAVALFTEGQVAKGIELGKAALKLDNNYGKIKFLEDNLWGKRLIEDTRKFFNDPQMKELVSNASEDEDDQASPVNESGLP